MVNKLPQTPTIRPTPAKQAPTMGGQMNKGHDADQLHPAGALNGVNEQLIDAPLAEQSQ